MVAPLHRRLARGSKQRHLQNNNNNNNDNGNSNNNKNNNNKNNKNQETPVPTRAPTRVPTQSPTRSPTQIPTVRPRTQPPAQRPVAVPAPRPSSTVSTTSPSSFLQKIPAPTPRPSVGIKPSFIAFQGTIHLFWSQLMIPTRRHTNTHDDNDDILIPLLQNWMAQEFLCLQSTTILLTSSVQLKSDCKDATPTATTTISNGDANPTSPTILWNTPTTVVIASQNEMDGISYTQWTMSFPVYDEYSEDLETQLQNGLDSLILKEQIEPPLEAAILSVVGMEEETFGGIILDLLDNATTLSPSASPYLSLTYPPTIPVESTTLDSSSTIYASTSEEYAVMVLRSIGGLLVILHTTLLILLHMFGRPYLKQRIRKTRGVECLDVTQTDSRESSTDTVQTISYCVVGPSLTNHHHHQLETVNIGIGIGIEQQQQQQPSLREDADNQFATYGHDRDNGLGLLLMATNAAPLNRRDASGTNPSPNKTNYYARTRSA